MSSASPAPGADSGTAPLANGGHGGHGGHGFGTAPVFLASISTILGAILFLRFGYAVGNVGMFGALMIVFIGHLVTLPTALAVSEIATNRKVEGGGAYFIISRSFGRTIGASIGISLYFSQAISISFYMIALAEAFRPLAGVFENWTGLPFDTRLIALPSTAILCLLVVFRGANIGIKALWAIVAVLAISLIMFFAGEPVAGTESANLALFSGVEDGDSFWLVFAIVFPAFTGLVAGLGLSGDLRNPRRAIPLGTLAATATGLAVYILAVIKLAYSAPAALLASDPLVMSQIAIWGPIIPIGLGCATLSSALGSVLVAPRTLQALAGDQVAPSEAVNRFLGAGTGASNEPRNAALITALLAVATAGIGSIDFVARIVSMFFMVTYGSLCAISFLEHFAARPSYRPTFRSKWYLSLLGAVLSLLLMFQMDPGYALLALILMCGIYWGLKRSAAGQDDLADIFRGVMTQTTRHFLIKLQRTSSGRQEIDWRPNLIVVGERTFERSSHLQLVTWLCQRQGFGTYLHLVRGRLDAAAYIECEREVIPRLVDLTEARASHVVVDTLVSPSLRTALAQAFQMPSVTGKRFNATMLEFALGDPESWYDEMIDGCDLAWQSRTSPLLLRHGERFFGSRRQLHLWLTWHDLDNAPLMILLAYILLGHQEWAQAELRIYAAFPRAEVARETARLVEMIREGRLPISVKNLRIVPTDDAAAYETQVEASSSGADLVILGFTPDRIAKRGAGLLRRFPKLSDVLFVSAAEKIVID